MATGYEAPPRPGLNARVLALLALPTSDPLDDPSPTNNVAPGLMFVVDQLLAVFVSVTVLPRMLTPPVPSSVTNPDRTNGAFTLNANVPPPLSVAAEPA